MKATLPRGQQALVLGGLVVILAVAVAWGVRTMNAPAAARVTSQAGTGARPSNQAGAAAGRGNVPNVPVSGLKLDALKHEEEDLPDAERNPFRFRPKAPPPPPPRPAAPPVQAFVPPPQQPQGPAPPPPIPLRYIGSYVNPANERIATLSDARGTPYFGKEGEIIDGRYRVLRVAPDSVDIAYADGRGRQTLRMTQPPQ